MVLEERVSRLEGAYERVDRRLADLHESMEGLRTDVNGRIDALHTEMNSGLSSLRTDMEKRFNTLYMVVGSTSVAVLIAMIGILVTIIQRF